jgi:orotidine-5'-phosphate decarboxylase
LSAPVGGVAPGDYLDRLAARTEAVGNCLCLGVDPDPVALPAGYPASIAGVERFARLLIETAAPFAAAVKINAAFFEAFGSAGIAALERVRGTIPADLPFIADAKRGDIGNTAARQAVALFDALGADAVTASPYLGLDAIAPFLERADRFVYVLARTSNAGAAEIQDLALGEGAAGEHQPLYLHVARRVAAWNEDRARLGLVVGATAPAELAAIRAVAPGLAFLVPGVGAQGGEVPPVLRHGRATQPPAGALVGGGLLVNVSRGIAAAALDSSDPAAALQAAARDWAGRLAVLG